MWSINHGPHEPLLRGSRRDPARVPGGELPDTGGDRGLLRQRRVRREPDRRDHRPGYLLERLRAGEPADASPTVRRRPAGDSATGGTSAPSPSPRCDRPRRPVVICGQVRQAPRSPCCSPGAASARPSWKRRRTPLTHPAAHVVNARSLEIWREADPDIAAEVAAHSPPIDEVNLIRWSSGPGRAPAGRDSTCCRDPTSSSGCGPTATSCCPMWDNTS